MINDPAPITEDHVAFARELVAVARKHGASHLRVDFQLSSSLRFRQRLCNYTSVTMSWNEGRHGIRAHLTLQAQATAQVEELPAQPLQEGDHA